MRAVLTALLLCSAVPAMAAASDQAPYPDPLDGIQMRAAKPVDASHAPYLDPCQCVRGTPIRSNRAPAAINDPATIIHGEPPKGPETEKPDRPIGMG